MSSRQSTSPQSNIEQHCAISGGVPIVVAGTNETEWLDTKDYAYAILTVVSSGTGADWTSATLSLYENDVASDTGEAVAPNASSTVLSSSGRAFMRSGVVRLHGRKRYIKGSFVGAGGTPLAVTTVMVTLHGPEQSITPGDTPVHAGASVDLGWEFEA